MLASLSPLIVRGVIDNTVRGHVTLQLWGIDGGEPLEYALEGNCLQDIAGCRVAFTNNAHVAEQQQEHPVLRRMRADRRPVLLGDFTLSRRVPERDNRRALCNMLSLELFPGTEMRILIESSDFTYDLSLPQWQMTWEEANLQALENMEHLRAHVAVNRSQFCGPAMADIRESGFPACVWDTRLNYAEAGMAIFPTVQEKYRYSRTRRSDEAFVMGRTDILEQQAMEDEAHLPPDAAEQAHEWEVTDFLEPEYARAVKRAMHHPLFTATSRMTGIVQKQLMQQGNGRPVSQEAERFINGYAAIVSHILATILLTKQKQFSTELAMRRLHILSSRISALPTLFDNPAGQETALIREAAGALISQLDDFSGTLQA